MNRPRAARPLALMAAALACVLAALAGLAWGWAGSPSAAGVPVPASAIAQLTVLASRAAQANGDGSPQWMTVVRTTRAKALTSATPGDLVPGADGVRVYLVTMRGHFTAYGSSVPPGAALPTGEYLSIVVDARTFQVLDFGLSPTPPRIPPASLGPVTYLTELREAGVSRGSLYHHFASKEALFEAVAEEVETSVGAQTVAAASGSAGPVEALRAGFVAWIRLAGDPVVRRILLIDGPSVLGWERWRAMEEHHALGLVRAGIQIIADEGRVRPELVSTLAHVLLASVNEVALLVARADDKEAAMQAGADAIDELLRRLFS
jgi:AcrR family transcriptional regulator